MGFAIAGAIVAGAAVSYAGQQEAAQGAQSAAEAQQSAAAVTRADALRESKRLETDANRLAQATPQELQAYQASLNSATAGLAQRERQIAAIDPALMEASQQVLKLLRGEDAASLKPAMAQRQQQRQQLVNSLRSKYGPGAEESSLGQKILSQFDMDSNVLTSQLQQSALNQTFGIASQAGQVTDRTNALAGINNAGTNFSNLQSRLLNSRMQTGVTTLGALSGTSQQMINTAGAQYTGQALQGQALSSLGNQFLQAGTTAGGAYAGGYFSQMGKNDANNALEP